MLHLQYLYMSNQNKKFPLAVGDQGQVIWAKIQTPTPLMMSSTKKRNQKLNFFSLPTRKLAAFFEHLNSFLAQSVGSVAKQW